MRQSISGMRVCVLCTACSDRNIEKTVGHTGIARLCLTQWCHRTRTDGSLFAKGSPRLCRRGRMSRIVLFFAVFYGDIYVHILDGTNLGRIVEAMILVVFSFLDYLICFISVAEMDCLKDRRYAAAKESGEFYTISQIESSLFNYVPRTYTIYYRRGSRRLTFGVRTRTTGNPLEMGGREYFIGPTGKREQIVKDLETLMKEVKKYARFDKVLVQTINGEPVKR